MKLRNAVSHGFHPASIPFESVRFLITLARKLSKEFGQQNGVGYSDQVSVVVFRGAINQDDGMKRLVEQASEILHDVVGPGDSFASADWRREEDAQGRHVVILKLSDPAGTVIATFEPEELRDPSQVRLRLHRIWGDLLQIRSQGQLQQLLETQHAGGEY